MAAPILSTRNLAGAAAPLSLLLAVGALAVFVLLLDAGRPAMPLLALATAPAAVLLLVQRRLVWPNSVILAGAVAFLAGLVLATAVHDAPSPQSLARVAVRIAMVLWLAYLAAMIPLLERGRMVLLLLALVVICGLNAAISAALFLAGDPAAIDAFGTRLVSFAGGGALGLPTTIGGIYAVMLAAAFAIVVMPERRLWVSAVAALAAVALAVALALTQTRGGYVAAAAATMAVAAFRSRRALLTVLGVFAACIALALLYPPAVELLVERGGSYRLGTWERYLVHAWRHLPLGVGLMRPVHLTVAGVEIHHAHNLLISATTRGGVLGLAGMAAMIGGALYWSWRYAVARVNPVVLAMVVALAVAGMFDYDLRPTRPDWLWVLFWLPVALAAGCELACRRDRPAAPAAAPDASPA